MIKEMLQNSLLHLLFPASCLHCHTLLPPSPLVLCPSCASLLELSSLYDRCSICFNILEDEYSIPCKQCLHSHSPYTKMASAFDYEGPAASLVKQLKYSNQPHLCSAMAAFLVCQFDRLKWPMPDALIPVPISLTHLMQRGYNQSALLAEGMGRILKRPMWDVLKRKSGDFSQALLSFEERKKLESNRFKIKSNASLEGKILLVIDDVLTTGSTLKCCADLLQEKQPAALYSLTFCRTVMMQDV